MSRQQMGIVYDEDTLTREQYMAERGYPVDERSEETPAVEQEPDYEPELDIKHYGIVYGPTDAGRFHWRKYARRGNLPDEAVEQDASEGDEGGYSSLNEAHEAFVRENPGVECHVQHGPNPEPIQA